MTPSARAALESIARALFVLAAEPDATPAAPADELVLLADAGIELRALRRAIREGRIVATQIGRRRYVRRSDLLRLAEPQPQPTGLVARAMGGAR